MAIWGFIFLSEILITLHHMRDGRRRTPGQKFIRVFAIIGLLCILYGYFIEPYWPQVRNITIQSDKLEHTSFTMVHISDLHCEKKIRAEKKIVKIINALNPDIIVFTGDSLNFPDGLKNLQDTFTAMQAPLGKFAVKGNWDTSLWYDMDLFKGTDFIEINEETLFVEKNGEKIAISGIPANIHNLKKLNFPSGYFNVFLHHFSDFIEKIDPNVDLYLSGHTHGGQIAMPIYGAIITLAKFGKKYEAGKYQVNNTTLYVNRGIGMEGGKFSPRVRFFVRPEVTFITIEPKK